MSELLLLISDVISETLTDTGKLLPFLFLTYVAMEYLEHRAGEHTEALVRKAGRLGPLIGALAGVVPQCGFSAAAANLFAGRVITMGTLLAIFLSTSDEMLPILISEQAPISLILSILGCKILIALVAGFIVDQIFRPREEHEHIHELCENEHCHCEDGVFRSAFRHTTQIAVFLFFISLVLNFALHGIGEEALESLLSGRPLLAPFMAGIVGLIPNCASSVAITKLYLAGILNFGGMLSGLLVNAGVGVLVLFRINHERRENLRIVGLLLLVGIASGSILSFV